MVEYFTPPAGIYFSHLNRQSIKAVVAEVRGADFSAAVGSTKKAEAADHAEKAIKDSGWLPQHIRVPLAIEDDTEDQGGQQFPIAAE
jgi:ParB family chromosome partitioning protein